MSQMAERIKALHGQGMLKRSALNIRGGAGVFERVLAGKGCRTALEIGTYRGVSAAEISQHVERVVTVDLRFGRMEQLGDKHDRHEFWRSLGIENVWLELVHDDTEKAALIERLEFDFAFIDGGHSRASVELDFNLVRRCGRVLFHDADDNRLRPGKEHAPNHVYEFLSTLPAEQLTFMDIFALWEGK